jgi:hypothetical protein
MDRSPLNLVLKGMFAACLFFPVVSAAQSDIDALRYSQQTFGVTARSMGMGGAFGALGADYSALAINPAGIGFYRKSEFSFTMGFNNRTIDSETGSSINSLSRFSFDLPNMGIVFAFPGKKKSDWKQFGFGIGYHRTANFNSESYYEGRNDYNSMLDAFTEEIYLNGGASTEDLFNYYPFDAYLAYQTWLINPDSLDPNQYNSVIPNGGAYQSRSSVTRGGMGEFSLAFGGNFNERVYFGVSIAFPNIRYEEESVYTEEDRFNTISVADTLNIRSFKYYQFLHTQGTGFNAKFGLIVRPSDWIRFGASIQTPTWYFLTDNYHASMSSSFEGGGYSSVMDSPEGVYSYDLRTPFKATGSVALILGKIGLLSFDYEATNYTSAELDASDYSFSEENSQIRQVYSSFASNYRGGIEIKLGDIALRGGVAYYSSPFNEENQYERTDQHVMSYTGGMGYRGKRYFLDVGYSYSERSEYFSPYSLAFEAVPGVIQDRTDHRVFTTIGVRF